MKTNDDLNKQNYPEEINWNHFFSIILGSKYLLTIIVAIFSIVGLITSLNITPLFTSSTVISTYNSNNNDLNQLQSSYGSLASAAGIEIPGQGGEDKSELAIKLITSRDFIKHLMEVDESLIINIMAAKSYNKENKSIELDSKIFTLKNNWVDKKPSYLEVHRVFLDDIIVLNKEKRTGYITISATHLSPVYAKYILDLVIEELDSIIKKRDLDEADRALDFLSEQFLNTSLSEIRKSLNQLMYKQLQTQLMANVSEGYFIKVLDSSFIPDKKSYPPRILVLIFFTFLGLLFGLVYVFVKHYKENNII